MCKSLFWTLWPLLLVAGCSRDDDDALAPGSGQTKGSAEFRAIAGVSMGAYGAMNLGTKHPEMFGVIGALGGPVDLRELLWQTARGLEVKPLIDVPDGPEDELSFDHPPPYPDRDSRLELLRDLMIAFGNPFLHHPDPSRRYLASDSEAAVLLADDVFGQLDAGFGERGFLDGGDANEDGQRQGGEVPDAPIDVLLVARNSLEQVSPGAGGALIGERSLADLDGDGVFDVGDGIVVNFSEPFVDQNGNLNFEASLGESFEDLGLDGVAGTGDFGEGNGVFDYDPDRARWLEEDPVTRLVQRSPSEIERQRIYMDVGTEDEFRFESHYLNVVALLRDKGAEVQVHDGFSSDCFSIPDSDARFQLVRYAGGHIGIPDADDIDEQLLAGDVCGTLLIWQRMASLLGFLDASFPDGKYGPGGLRPVGDVIDETIVSRELAAASGGEGIPREVVVYLPPAFFNTGDDFPVVYFLGGYGQDPEDFERMGELLDLLIAADEIQNMYFAFLPGSGGLKGSFYVNHSVPESQVPDIPQVTSGRFEDSLLELIEVIEDEILDGRVRR